MKQLNSFLLSFIVFFAFSCSKNNGEISNQQQSNALTQSTSSTSTTESSSPYIVTLESVTQTGNASWTWIWSVRNSNPGNGNNGTVQDLSHWGFTLGECITAENIISAAYSFNGTDWVTFTPTIGVDPSQTCMQSAVLKFDAGTVGHQKTYYSLTVNQNYVSEPLTGGYYKSGNRTGCGLLSYMGIGCGTPTVGEER